MTRAAALFVSHGAPTLPIEDIPARRFLETLGETVDRPDAICCVSAHWDTGRAAVTGATRLETIHDFYGFSPPLYALRYPAPGAPALAADIAARLGGDIDPARGLDHGAWVPLLMAYPDADVPVAQVSLQSAQGPRGAYDMGRRLRDLRTEGVMLLASGGITHNLRAVQAAFQQGGAAGPPPDWTREFVDWIADRLEARDIETLLDYRAAAPFAGHNHPTDEHFLPLFVLLGALFDDERPRRLHQSYSYGVLAMDAWGAGSDAA